MNPSSSVSVCPFLLLYSNIPMDLLLGCLPSPGSPPFLNGASRLCSRLVSLGLPRSSDAAMWDVWSMQDVLPSCGCRHRHTEKRWFPPVSLSSWETNWSDAVKTLSVGLHCLVYVEFILTCSDKRCLCCVTSSLVLTWCFHLVIPKQHKIGTCVCTEALVMDFCFLFALLC